MMCDIPVCDVGIKMVNKKGLCCPVCENTNVCVDSVTKFAYRENAKWWDQGECKSLCQCTSNGTVCNKPIRDCKSPVKLNRKCGKVCVEIPAFDSVYP
jgi:hypothetical protein